MAKSWHKKHISTKWGIAIIGFLLLSVILTVFVLSKSQDLRSNAMVKKTDISCVMKNGQSGHCIAVSSNCRTYSTRKTKCQI